MPEAIFPLETANIATLSGLLHTVRITPRDQTAVLAQANLARTEYLTRLDSLLANVMQTATEAFTNDVSTITTTTTTTTTPPLTGDLATLVAIKDLLDQAIAAGENLRDTVLPQLEAFALANDAASYDALRMTSAASLAALVATINGSTPNLSSTAFTTGDGQQGLDTGGNDLVDVFSPGAPGPQRVAASTDFANFSGTGANSASRNIQREIAAGPQRLNKALTNLQDELANIEAQIAALGGIPTGTTTTTTATTTTELDTGTFSETDFSTLFDEVRDLFGDYTSKLSVIYATGVDSFRNILRISRPELFPFIENGARAVTGNVVVDADIAKRLRGTGDLFDRSDATIRTQTITSNRLDLNMVAQAGETDLETLLRTATTLAEVETFASGVFDSLGTVFDTVNASLFVDTAAGLDRDPTAFTVAFAKVQGYFRDPAFARPLIDVKA